MSNYFDEKDRQLREIKKLVPDDPAWCDRIRKWEMDLVFDCTVCVELPGCPTDIRDTVHSAVLRWGVETLPPNAPPVDFERYDDHVNRLADLSYSIHSAFHELAQMYEPGWSDSPLAPLRAYYSAGDERRNKMVVVAAGKAESSDRREDQKPCVSYSDSVFTVFDDCGYCGGDGMVEDYARDQPHRRSLCSCVMLRAVPS